MGYLASPFFLIHVSSFFTSLSGNKSDAPSTAEALCFSYSESGIACLEEFRRSAEHLCFLMRMCGPACNPVTGFSLLHLCSYLTDVHLFWAHLLWLLLALILLGDLQVMPLSVISEKPNYITLLHACHNSKLLKYPQQASYDLYLLNPCWVSVKTYFPWPLLIVKCLSYILYADIKLTCPYLSPFSFNSPQLFL